MPLVSVPGVVQMAKSGRFSHLVVRFQQWGCNNRPFYHIVVDKSTHPNRRHIDPVEQVGTYDPSTNSHNEKLVSLNLERLQEYLAGGVQLSRPVAQLIGLAGLTPQHPDTYVQAWRNREAISNEEVRRGNVVLRGEN
eukprot:TRINITY_DN47017_c0_g1_i1.p1 TRINITY_DN47017_c0_g1~~TRINITY_DN47017_c0_g1_i1.p1  ORF type:complete len:137 (+),score=54.90 TRINITY_DN47017_c0_g1_i1:57-467(+)